MKYKIKILYSFLLIIIITIPSLFFNISAVDNNLVNYSNDYVGLYDEVKDGVVMISNITNSGISSGTGMVYKEDENYLYMLTNHHVIEGTTKLYVEFNNHHKEEAFVLGSDSYMDVAVIYCEKPSLYKVLTYANSRYTKIGEEIMAIGNPVSQTMEYTVTKGIIANLDIDVSYGNFYKDKHLTMVDMALNPGNSGGPSFNVYGHVIGINSLKYTYDGYNYYEGLNFMIPISDALNVANRIEHHKNHVFVRPYFGNGNFIDIQELTLLERNYLNIPCNIGTGIYLEKFSEEKNCLIDCGVTANSIIISLANQRVNTKAELRRVLYSLNIYQKVEIKYIDLNDNQTLKTAHVAINGLVLV